MVLILKLPILKDLSMIIDRILSIRFADLNGLLWAHKQTMRHSIIDFPHACWENNKTGNLHIQSHKAHAETEETNRRMVFITNQIVATHFFF